MNKAEKTNAFTSSSPNDEVRNISLNYAPTADEYIELQEISSKQNKIIEYLRDKYIQLETSKQTMCAECPLHLFKVEQSKGKRHKTLNNDIILQWHGEGKSNRAIAKILNVSEGTIRNRLKNHSSDL